MRGTNPRARPRASEGPARLVASGTRADGDHRHPVWPRDRDAGRPGIEPEEGPDLDRDLLAVDPVSPRAGDDDVDLLLARLELVVLAPLGVRRDLEPVDPEGLDAENAAHEAHGPSRPRRLDLVDVDHRVAHQRSFYLHAEDAERRLRNGPVRGGGEPECEDASCVERVDDPVVPEACGRV